MREFIFTFGHGQPHFGYYHVIKAMTDLDARWEMYQRFGEKWSMMYDNREAAGVYEFNLKELK